MVQVRAEDKALSTRLAELAEQWNANKPLHGTCLGRPTEASKS